MKTFVSFLFVMLCAVTSSAQITKLGPNDSLRINWPAAIVSPDTLDEPDGFRVKATSTTVPGSVLKTWTTAKTVQTLTVVAIDMPTGAFQITVHPFNAAGEAAASNSVGPFGKAAVPKTLSGVTGSVVAGGSALLERPVFGGQGSTLTATSILSTTPKILYASLPQLSSVMGNASRIHGLLPQEMLGDFGSPTYSQSPRLETSTLASR